MLIEKYQHFKVITQQMLEAMEVADAEGIESLVSERQKLMAEIGDRRPGSTEVAQVRSLLNEIDQLNREMTSRLSGRIASLRGEIQRQQLWAQALQGYGARYAGDNSEGRFIDRRR